MLSAQRLTDGDLSVHAHTPAASTWAVVQALPDTTDPTVQLTSPTAGQVVTKGSVVRAAYSCADGGSGIATCAGTVVNDAPIDTSVVGAHPFSVTATDHKGNVASVTNSYQVRYAWGGFRQPIDAEPVLNVTKPGDIVPIRFSLGGNQGSGVLSGTPSSVAISCGKKAPSDKLKEALTTGADRTTYDGRTAAYTYGWSTQKSWRGTCRQLTLSLADGTTRTASFQFG